jgi:hypothetical protein
MALEVFLSPSFRPSACAKGICGSKAFDPFSPESPEGDGERRFVKPIQQAITSTAATPTAVSHRPTFNEMRFARLNAPQAERVMDGSFPARAMKDPQGWYIARFVTAAVSSRVARAGATAWEDRGTIARSRVPGLADVISKSPFSSFNLSHIPDSPTPEFRTD